MQEFDFDSENDVVDESFLSEPEVAAAAALGINTKRLSKKAYAQLKQKAEEMVSQASVPSKTAREAAKGIVKGGGKKSAEVSARSFQKALEKGPIKVPSGPVISDLPQVSGKMGAAMQKASSAAAGVPWSPAEGVINLPGPAKSSLLDKIKTLASTSAGKKALVGMGLGAAIGGLAKMAGPVGAIEGLYSGEGEGPEPTDPYLNPPQQVDYTPSSTEKSDLNPLMASSKYDTLGSIISDVSRPKAPFYPTPTGAPVSEEALNTEQEAKKLLAPSSRTISAGEPTAAEVKKQAEDAQLQKILQQPSEYEDLLARFRDAQERQRMAQLGVGLTQAAERIGSAIAMTKPGDQSVYEQAMKQAGGITDQFKDEFVMATEAEKRDPKSAISKTYQNLVKSMGIAITGNESAEALTKALPFLQQYQSQKENREARQQQFQLQKMTIEAEKEKSRQAKFTGEQNTFLDRERARFAKDKVHEAVFILKDAERAVDAYLKNPNPTTSQGLAYAFAKVNDPNSVVRESELKLFGQAGSLFDRFKQTLQMGVKGTIPAKKAEEFKNFISGKIRSAEEDIKTKLTPIVEGGKRRGLEPQDIIDTVAGPEYYKNLFEKSPAQTVKKETIKLDTKLAGKAGKPFTDSKTGKRYIVNPDEESATEL